MKTWCLFAITLVMTFIESNAIFLTHNVPDVYARAKKAERSDIIILCSKNPSLCNRLRSMGMKHHKRSTMDKSNDFLQNDFDFEEYHEENNRRTNDDKASKRTIKKYYLVEEGK
uniref:Uncharacterized protein n=1 Tax=Clytia hemisphaerica TaxID=252671 RepID=A0A7M5V612_9CNID|eukprot:TCONS_00070036-protein